MITLAHWDAVLWLWWVCSISTVAADGGDSNRVSVMKHPTSMFVYDDENRIRAVAATGTVSSETSTSTHGPFLLRREQVRIDDTVVSYDHSNMVSPAHSRNEEEERRDLQIAPSFMYNANYTLQYQLLRDSTCTSPSPVLRVMCLRSYIQLLNVSDASIQCSTERRVDDDGWSYLECTNNCTDSACRTVYLQVDRPSNDGPFASIDFQCASDTLSDIDAASSYEASDPGTCAASSTGVTRILQILRMGVLCPVRDGSGNVVDSTSASTNREYEFDDSYFKCSGGMSYPLGGDRGTEYYTCLGGQSCNGVACTVNLTRVLINANVQAFAQQCVGTLSTDGTVTLSPTPLPTAPELAKPEGEDVSVRFEASWSLMFDPSTAAVCYGYTPVVQIECLYGSQIQYISSIYDSMNCTTISLSILSCTDTGANDFIDTFTSVVYVRANGRDAYCLIVLPLFLSSYIPTIQECTANNVPQSEVTFVENNAYCDGNTIDGVVTHALQLGIYCTLDKLGYSLFSGELFFSCVGVSPTFSYQDEMGSTQGTGANRFTCSETVTIPSGSTTAQPKAIRQLSISTDANWRIFPDPACYTIGNGTAANSATPTGSITTRSSTTVTTPAPVVVRTPSAPIPAWTIQETNAPVMASVPAMPASTLSPVATTTTTPVTVVPAPMSVDATAPVANPALAVPASTPLGETTSSSSDEGFPAAALAGGIGGAFVVGAAVVAFCILSKKNINAGGAGPLLCPTTR